MKGMRYSYRVEGQEKIKGTGEKLCQEPEDLLSHSNKQLWGTVPGGKEQNKTEEREARSSPGTKWWWLNLE